MNQENTTPKILIMIKIRIKGNSFGIAILTYYWPLPPSHFSLVTIQDSWTTLEENVGTTWDRIGDNFGQLGDYLGTTFVTSWWLQSTSFTFPKDLLVITSPLSDQFRTTFEPYCHYLVWAELSVTLPCLPRACGNFFEGTMRMLLGLKKAALFLLGLRW